MDPDEATRLSAQGVDVSTPNVARMYDYFLGGAANFAADRDTAEKALAVTPEIGRFARANRHFLGRVVSHLCERGVEQFLDLGSGIPTVGNVHEIAQRHNPNARVAYVEQETVAVMHARALLADEPRATMTQADIRDARAVLSAPGVTDLLDFTKPVAVLAIAIVHFIPDEDDPAAILRAYTDECAPGSYLALSHASTVTMTQDEVDRGRRLYSSTSTPLIIRDRDAITALLGEHSIVEPGVTPVNHWPAPTDETPVNGYGAVAEIR